MNADDRYDEWLLSDHPAAAAERARRGVTDPTQVAGLRDEWVAYARDWLQEGYTYPARLQGRQAAGQPTVPDPGFPQPWASERRARQHAAEHHELTTRFAAENGYPVWSARQDTRRAWAELAGFEAAALVQLRTNPHARRQRAEEAAALSDRVQTGLELENAPGRQGRDQILARGLAAVVSHVARCREHEREGERER